MSRKGFQIAIDPEQLLLDFGLEPDFQVHSVRGETLTCEWQEVI